MRHLLFLFLAVGIASADETPLRQASSPPPSSPLPLTLRDAARDDRWLGVGVRNVRWSPGGDHVFFQWNVEPAPEEDPELDPWFRAERSGARAKRVPENEAHLVPAETLSFSANGGRATWSRAGSLYLYDGSTRRVLSMAGTIRNATMRNDGRSVHFMLDEDLFEYGVGSGTLRQITRKRITPPEKNEAQRWLELQHQELFERHRTRRTRDDRAAAQKRQREVSFPQSIPIEEGWELCDVALSPNGRHVSFHARKPHSERKPTVYLDYATSSGDAEAHEARAKVGAPDDEHRMGIVRFDPSSDPEEIDVTWVDCSNVDDGAAIVYGPYWNGEGDRALVQIVSLAYKDRWIGELDVETGLVEAITHDHDDAWLGGPPPVAGYLQPSLLEWLPDGSFVFASERTGWSHLYRVERDGTIEPLTSGEWEVRGARLSRDRSRWLIAASREHPSDDHLYAMPGKGGELVRLTTEPGRHTGYLSPDGERIAALYSDSVRLPDLFLRDVKPRRSRDARNGKRHRQLFQPPLGGAGDRVLRPS